jgi:hypothetical protein
MKPIEKHEIFENLSSFLKTKGIELKAGSYSQGVQKACEILADTVNLSQRGLERAKDTLDKNLDRVRQVIHEKTAPKPPPVSRKTAPKPNVKANPASSTSSVNKPSAQKKSRRSKGRR